MDAYRKAIALLPDHPAPHIGLGLLTLGSYPNIRDIPPQVIRSVQKELEIAKELEAKNPSLAKEAGLSSGNLEDMLSVLNYNDATATVNAVTRIAYQTTQTAEATRDYATRTLWAITKASAQAWYATDMNCWATAGAACTASPTVTLTPKPTRTATPIPSATHPPSTSPTTASSTNNGPSTVIMLTGGIGLIIVGYVVLKRLQKK